MSIITSNIQEYAEEQEQLRQEPHTITYHFEDDGEVMVMGIVDSRYPGAVHFQVCAIGRSSEWPGKPATAFDIALADLYQKQIKDKSASCKQGGDYT